MRLIDADELRKRMYHDAFETDSDMQKWDGGCWIRYKMFENAIEDAPTIEAEPNSCEYWDSESHFCALRRPQADPVRRGHWLFESINQPDEYCVCSECGTQVDSNEAWHYCPNCGAKMEEQE